MTDEDLPIVELEISARDVTVWDSVTYTIISRVESDNESFENNRTFYYDFTWDGVWDLITKKDTVTYTFLESYEGGIQPKVAVEFRNKVWKADWEKIYVKELLRPILLYTSYKNIALFRDMSMWDLIERKICFEKSECELWNKKFINSEKADLQNEFWIKSNNPITKNDMFIQRYPNYWNHEVSIELKDKYWMLAKTWFIVKTSESTANNGRIAPGVNILTIPETTFNNNNPEIFLPKIMNDTLLMYVNYELDWTCYLDTDINIDTDWDHISDNDNDAACNTLSKLKYYPESENAIWRITFTTSEWKQVSQNFYITFEWYILELSDEYTVWPNSYEKNKEEILSILPYNSRSGIRDMFQNFEDNLEMLDNEAKATEFKNIRNRLFEGIWQKNGKIDKSDASLIDKYFCNIFEYYDITSYTKTCWK